MGTTDIPPPHVASNYLFNVTIALGGGGLFWTITYVLMARQSLRDSSYSMPLFSLAFNFGWEIVFSLYVAESIPEQVTFATWMLVDLGLVYSVLKFAKYEWAHSPFVVRHIGKIFSIFVLWWCWALWAISTWWLDPLNPINRKEGKIYRGHPGIDTTELGYWTSLIAQVVLSVMLLAQLVVRGHSGGTSYAIWANRFLGSIIGLVVYFWYCFYTWPEAHGYVTSRPSVCFTLTWIVADIAYVFILRSVKKTEIILKGGRKVRGGEHGKAV